MLNLPPYGSCTVHTAISADVLLWEAPLNEFALLTEIPFYSVTLLGRVPQAEKILKPIMIEKNRPEIRNQWSR